VFPEPEQQEHGGCPGDGKQQESRPVAARQGQGYADHQRTDESADLIECLMECESLPPTEPGAGFGEHDVLRRTPDSLAQALGKDEDARNPEGARDAEERDRQSGEPVAGDRQAPPQPGPVREPAEEQAHHECEAALPPASAR